MKKRGSLFTIEVLVEVVLAVTLIIFAATWVGNELGSSKYERDFYSNDIALISEIALGAPGIMLVEYDGSHRFELEVEAKLGLITIFDREESSAAIYPISTLTIEESRVPLRKNNITKNETFNIR